MTLKEKIKHCKGLYKISLVCDKLNKKETNLIEYILYLEFICEIKKRCKQTKDIREEIEYIEEVLEIATDKYLALY